MTFAEKLEVFQDAILASLESDCEPGKVRAARKALLDHIAGLERATAHAQALAIEQIAVTANNVAWQAGVGGMELAGQIVSFLHARPEFQADFLSGKIGLVDLPMRPEDGCLSWQAVNGKIITPEQFKELHPELANRFRSPIPSSPTETDTAAEGE